jgi:uncharacterized protein YdcH (DUF465 family)
MAIFDFDRVRKLFKKNREMAQLKIERDQLFSRYRVNLAIFFRLCDELENLKKEIAEKENAGHAKSEIAVLREAKSQKIKEWQKVRKELKANIALLEKT